MGVTRFFYVLASIAWSVHAMEGLVVVGTMTRTTTRRQPDSTMSLLRTVEIRNVAVEFFPTCSRKRRDGFMTSAFTNKPPEYVWMNHYDWCKTDQNVFIPMCRRSFLLCWRRFLLVQSINSDGPKTSFWLKLTYSVISIQGKSAKGLKDSKSFPEIVQKKKRKRRACLEQCCLFAFILVKKAFHAPESKL